MCFRVYFLQLRFTIRELLQQASSTTSEAQCLMAKETYSIFCSGGHLKINDYTSIHFRPRSLGTESWGNLWLTAAPFVRSCGSQNTRWLASGAVQSVKIPSRLVEFHPTPPSRITPLFLWHNSKRGFGLVAWSPFWLTGVSSTHLGQCFLTDSVHGQVSNRCSPTSNPPSIEVCTKMQECSSVRPFFLGSPTLAALIFTSFAQRSDDDQRSAVIW